MFRRLAAKLKNTGPQQRVFGPVEYIICGLGNPGPKYQDTRHNVGYRAVDHLADKLGAGIWKAKFKAFVTEAMLEDKRIVLMKPTTYMNLSGDSVREVLANYKLPPERLIVLYDDVSLPAGKLRIRLKGSDGGHNGIKSIIAQTGSEDFPRVKFGVGQKPHPDYDLADWVLGKPLAQDSKALAQLFDELPDICSLIMAGRPEEAMNRYN